MFSIDISKPFSLLVVGQSRTGKSTFVNKLIKSANTLNPFTSIKLFSNNPEQIDGVKYNYSGPANNAELGIEQKSGSLIVFDDVLKLSTMTNFESTIQMAIYGTYSVICVVQNIQSVPIASRKMFKNIAIFQLNTLDYKYFEPYFANKKYIQDNTLQFRFIVVNFNERSITYDVFKIEGVDRKNKFNFELEL